MNITLVPAQSVPDIFSARIKSRLKDEKVFITSMSAHFQNNPIIKDLMRYGGEGDVFAIDYFGHWHGVIPSRFRPAAHHKARAAFQRNFQGSYTVIGPPPRINVTNSTILNRSHIKAYAVGNKVLSLGGVNCVPCSYNFIDVMLDFESDEFVSYLRKLSEKGVDVRKDGAGERFWLDAQNEVLVDYGRRNNRLGRGNKSVILSALLNDLNDQIKSVTLSSTAIPYGAFDNVLFHHAQKGRRITFYTNHPSKFHPPDHSRYERLLQRAYSLKARTIWTDNRPDRFNHLKAAIIEYKNNKRLAYVGSHNFQELYVWAGTSELCLRTTDNRLIEQLSNFITDNLSSN